MSESIRQGAFEGRLVLHEEALAPFPGMQVVGAVVSGLDNACPRPSVARLWEEAWEQAGDALAVGAPQAHPRIAPWRTRFRAAGVSPKAHPSAVEALARRAARGGPPFRINPLVDLYNALSLRYLLPVGAFDLAGIPLLDLRVTRPGDTFQALDAATPDAVPAGEVAYAAGNLVLARHMAWRQSRFGLVTPDTRAAIVVCEVLGEVETDAPGLAATFLNDLVALLRGEFGVDPLPFLLGASNLERSWHIRD